MNKIFQLDWALTICITLLLALGLLALYSISFQDSHFIATNFSKQATSIVIGLAAMLALSFWDYRMLNMHSTKLYFFGIAILVIVIIWGTTVRGTTGWIGFGSFHVQPVEIIKIIMIIFLASFLSKKKTQLSIVVRTIVSIVLVCIPVLLILKQPDFGSAAVVVGTWLIMLMVSGINKKNILILFLLGAILLTVGWFSLKTYQRERIENFINPYSDPLGSGYNVIQSMVAVGSGGLMGKGLGHGSQSQLNFLPEKHTDFIFAVIAEEMGLLGASFVLTLFLVLFYRLKEIARTSRDNFGYLLAVGVLVTIFLQVMVNIGMNIGIAPVTGVPLPFLSYGGSSLVTVLAAMGLVHSIYARRLRSLD